MSRRALVVTDDADEQYLAATVLRDALGDLQVNEAADAVAFATALGRGTLHLAVVVRTLAWADGLDLIRVLHQKHPECATVLLGETAPDLVDPDTQPDAHLSRSAAGLARLGRVALRAIECRSRAPYGRGAPVGLDGIPVALMRLSVDERVLSANAAAAALFGHTDTLALAGRALAALARASGANAAQPGSTGLAAAASAAAGGLEVIALPVAGSPVPCRLVVRTETREGMLAGFVAALLPLPPGTAQITGSLLYALSHDLRQPLLTTRQSAQMLSDRLKSQAWLGAEEERMLRRILSGSARMETLMAGLLEYVRTGQSPLAVAPFELGEVAEEIVQGLQPVLNGAGAVVRWHDLPRIDASRIEITRLLENLVTNAVKFHGPEAPVVEITCADRGDNWLLSVRDNGIGVDPAEVERIFEAFQRLHTETEYPGTGIGLAICRQVCERHAGRIWVTPNGERGSTFHATISKNLHNAHP